MNRRTRRTKKTDKGEDSDQDFHHTTQPNPDKEELRSARPARACKVNYYANQETNREEAEAEEAEEAEGQEEQVSYSFLEARVESLLWRREEGGQEEFLVKYAGRSYHHVEWVSGSGLAGRGVEVNASMLKSLKVRMRRTEELKLEEQHYFNPNFLQVDRVLTCSEIFTAVHHKRANDIKGKWEESLVLVCEKLLNFVRNGYPYSVLLYDHPDEHTPSVGISQILNRVYLGFYKAAPEFWREVGAALNNYLKAYPPDKGDFHTVGLVMRDAAILLYEQWHALTAQRYQEVARTMRGEQQPPFNN